MGLLAEYLFDGRDGEAPATTLDDDLFVGIRLALNDASDTSFLGGVFVDLRSGVTMLNIEANRRISDSWKLEVEARAFAGIPSQDPAFFLRDDHHLQIRMARYF